MEEPLIPVSGDIGVGAFEPPEVREPTFERLPPSELRMLRQVTGVSATTSDVLDELGLSLVVPSHVMSLRTGPALVVGQALTVRYLPERRAPSNPHLRHSPSRLAHHTVFRLAKAGDVVVIELAGSNPLSVLGGIAAKSALTAGVAGCIIDGGIRDVEQIRALGLPVWARAVTPMTGKWRVEAAGINVRIQCGGVQVHPGDLVIADESGVCFIPIDVAQVAIRRILDVTRQENQQLAAKPSRARLT